MAARIARTDLMVYWRLVEYFATKDSRLMSEVHAELRGYGLAPEAAHFSKGWDAPRPPGVPSRFSSVFISGRRLVPEVKRGVRRVSRSPRSGS